eukprot:1136500-Pelagomonas_calceolata.AAC.4
MSSGWCVQQLIAAASACMEAQKKSAFSMQNADSLHLNLWQGGEPLLWEDAPESAFFPSDEQSVGLTGGLFACDAQQLKKSKHANPAGGSKGAAPGPHNSGRHLAPRRRLAGK